jgi:mono/diheme cytochrome c family protein
MHRVLAASTVALILILSSRIAAVSASGPQDDASKPEFYTTKVKPILDENCARCHMGDNKRGGLNFSTREGLLAGGRDGKVVVPGDPANSLLIKLIRHEGPADDPMPMPPRKPKMSDDDIAVIEKWVKAGAIMP